MSVPIAQLPKTFTRFDKEIREFARITGSRVGVMKAKTLADAAEKLFARWKRMGKAADHKRHEAVMGLVPKIVAGSKKGLVALGVESLEMPEMIQAAKMAAAKAPAARIVLISKENGVKVVVAAGKSAVKKGFDSGKKAKEVCKKLGGSGGGKPDMGQGGGKFAAKVDEILKSLK